MTELRFSGAATTVELAGVDQLLPDVRRLVVDAGGPWLVPSGTRTVSARLVLDRTGSSVWLDGTALPEAADRAAAVVLGAVDRAMLGATPCLLIHAGALAGARGAAIFPGRSGSGKSTLVSAGMQQGLTLVSDEAACLEPGANLIWPHPRPLGLSGSSRLLLGLPSPVVGPPDTERWTAPGLLGASATPATPLEPRLLLIMDRVDAHSACGISPAGRSQVMARLLDNLLNTHHLDGSGGGARNGWTAERAWWRIGQLVEDASSARLTYHSPSCGGRLLGDALGVEPRARDIIGRPGASY